MLCTTVFGIVAVQRRTNTRVRESFNMTMSCEVNIFIFYLLWKLVVHSLKNILESPSSHSYCLHFVSDG